MKQQRTLIVMVVALITAGLATFAVYAAVQRMPVQQVEVDTVPVVVAARAVTVGTLLNADDVRVVNWPAKSQVQGTYADPKDVIDRGALETIRENQPLTDMNVASREMGAGLPPLIPPGMRAISVRINDVVGVAGFAMPGTRVDVLVSVDDNGDKSSNKEPMARTVVSNALVLTQGTRYDQQESKQGGKPAQMQSVVTLAVLPLDGERIKLAETQGQLSLALRNPLDADPTQTPGIKLGALMRGPGPEPVVVDPVRRKVAPKPTPQVVIAATPAPKSKIEVIRATKSTFEEIE